MAKQLKAKKAKPGRDQLNGMADKLKKLIHTITHVNHQCQRLSISNSNGNHLVPITDIIYCKTVKCDTQSGNMTSRIAFCLSDGRQIIVSNATLSGYEKALNPYLFARISQSCLINLMQVKIYKRKQGDVIMKGYPDGYNKHIEEEFPISKTRRASFDELYDSFTVSAGSR